MTFKPTSFHCHVAGVTFTNYDGSSRQDILEEYDGEKFSVMIKKAYFEGAVCYPVYIRDRDNSTHQVGYVPKQQIAEFEAFMKASAPGKVLCKSSIIKGSSIYGMSLSYSGEQEIEEPAPDNGKVFYVIIAGSRSFKDYKTLKSHCDFILQNKLQNNKVVVVTSCAAGAGQLGIRYARERKLRIEFCPALWALDGKKAALKRDAEMVAMSNALIAFCDGETKEASHIIDLARNAGLKVSVKTVEKEVKA